MHIYFPITEDQLKYHQLLNQKREYHILRANFGYTNLSLGYITKHILLTLESEISSKPKIYTSHIEIYNELLKLSHPFRNSISFELELALELIESKVITADNYREKLNSSFYFAPKVNKLIKNLFRHKSEAQY